MKSGDSPAQRLLYAFMQFKRVPLRGWQAEGRTPSEVMVLMSVKKHMESGGPGLKVSEISQRMRVKSPTITPVIRGLENDGLVERRHDAEDRRVVRITLTPEGEQLLKRIHERIHSTFDGLVQRLGEEDTLQLIELLGKSFQYLKEMKDNQEHSTDEGDEP
ncbi:MarR family transcriptional regulator [Paenibacillus sp. JX-17]|uniref:MarR family transcriptional regulator n=1 Tax=Paenibacillus lacisoli TaxID=3064525 RepID=A0ABT9CFM6_9BACL|nr:MarR family transcriptional regulator [Paenibacillus sp. JX-17]MDO7906403.1 MarR family transcriptional regulator [Paenibacillus sp. JX-17]